jgi:hypothetical protein
MVSIPWIDNDEDYSCLWWFKNAMFRTFPKGGQGYTLRQLRRNDSKTVPISTKRVVATNLRKTL